MDYVRTLTSMVDVCLTLEPGFSTLEDLAFLDLAGGAVHLLGTAYSSKDIEAIKEFSRSLIWFTYRKNWPAPIGGFDGPTSDRGWGCMIRVGQMVLAQALIKFHLGSDWRWANEMVDQRADNEQFQAYLRLLRMFQDKRTAQFSIHQIAQFGASEGKPIGEWLGPNSMAQVLKKIVVYDEWSNLVVHVAMDNVLISDDVHTMVSLPLKTENGLNDKSSEQEQKTNSPTKGQWIRPLLLIVPLRLGLTAINPCYFNAIAEYFKLPQCVGILGGRPRHAVYFYGNAGKKLLYLDPHICQEFTDIDTPPPSVCHSVFDDDEEDVARRFTDGAGSSTTSCGNRCENGKMPLLMECPSPPSSCPMDTSVLNDHDFDVHHNRLCRSITLSPPASSNCCHRQSNGGTNKNINIGILDDNNDDQLLFIPRTAAADGNQRQGHHRLLLSSTTTSQSSSVSVSSSLINQNGTNRPHQLQHNQQQGDAAISFPTTSSSAVSKISSSQSVDDDAVVGGSIIDSPHCCSSSSSTSEDNDGRRKSTAAGGRRCFSSSPLSSAHHGRANLTNSSTFANAPTKTKAEEGEKDAATTTSKCKNNNNNSTSDAFDDSSFHCPYILTMDFKSLDPSLALGFLTRDLAEYEDLVHRLKTVVLPSSSPPLFEILDSRPKGWPKFTPFESEFFLDNSLDIKDYDFDCDSDENFEILE
ncbi:hypothetical protein niasHS_002009 [Heterodera schachtii]|uniref:Cysteine protease n=2 Tax=Heterodera TaxID=34509 RepID=A0ABD2K5R6_HETSC